MKNILMQCFRFLFYFNSFIQLIIFCFNGKNISLPSKKILGEINMVVSKYII